MGIAKSLCDEDDSSIDRRKIGGHTKNPRISADFTQPLSTNQRVSTVPEEMEPHFNQFNPKEEVDAIEGIDQEDDQLEAPLLSKALSDLPRDTQLTFDPIRASNPREGTGVETVVSRGKGKQKKMVIK